MPYDHLASIPKGKIPQATLEVGSPTPHLKPRAETLHSNNLL